MTDEETETLAAIKRQRLLELWDGDPASADEFVKSLMELIEAVPAGVPKKARSRMVRRLALLLQR